MEVLIYSSTTSFSSVQSLSCVLLFGTPWTAACQASLSKHLELAQTQIHRVSDAIQPSHPLSSPYPPAFNLSPASGFLTMNQFFASGGQSIGDANNTWQFFFRVILFTDICVQLSEWRKPERQLRYSGRRVNGARTMDPGLGPALSKEALFSVNHVELSFLISEPG